MTKKVCGKSKDGARNINDVLDYELIVKIFMVLNVAELATVSMVCKSWEKACHDPLLWNKLDLTTLCSRPFNVPRILRHDWSDMVTITRMNRFLKNTLQLSDGNVKCLAFNFYAFLTDLHLISASQRTPNLKRLILPFNGEITEHGLDLAMRAWSGLQSITITKITNQSFIFSAIGKYCKGITEIKFTYDCFNQDLAEALVKYTPNLKFLSVQCITVNLKALLYVLEKLENLVAVNACHSPFLESGEGEDAPDITHQARELPQYVPMEFAKKVIYCEGRRCALCKNKERDGFMRDMSLVFEELWRLDEIESLAH